MSFLKIIAALLIAAWLLLVLLGKGGLVHIFLLSGIAVAVVDFTIIFRSRMAR